MGIEGLTRGYSDREAASKKKWAILNADRCRANERRYYEKNREIILARKREQYVPKLQFVRICPRCQKEFLTTRSTQIHCSTACKHCLTETICKCATCGNDFRTKHKRKYCSAKCSPWLRDEWDKSSRICANPRCQKSYTPRQRNQSYCKRECKPDRRGIEPFYRTKNWKTIRSNFLMGVTAINGHLLQNIYCVECFKKGGKLTSAFAVDHIIRRKDGGSDDPSNLQSLCKHHHASKSAIEGNLRYKVA